MSSRTPKGKGKGKASTSSRKSSRRSSRKSSASEVSVSVDEEVMSAASRSRPETPTRMARREEKVELRGLNSRLESYVMRNKAIEDEVGLLERQLADESEKKSELELNVSQLEVEVNTLRAQLKDLPGLRKERSELIMRVQRMEEAHSKEMSQLESDLRDEQANTQTLEEQVESLETELTKLRERARSADKAEKEAAALRRELESLREEHERLLVTLQKTVG